MFDEMKEMRKRLKNINTCSFRGTIGTLAIIQY